MKRIIVLFSLVCFFLSSGFTSVSAQNSVELGIILPSSGNYNNWIITFTGSNGTYTFTTNDDNFESQVLGVIPEGTYDIEFNSGYFPSGFDFGVCGPTYYHFRVRNDSFTWYGAVIEEGTYIQIDEGY